MLKQLLPLVASAHWWKIENFGSGMKLKYYWCQNWSKFVTVWVGYGGL